MNQSDPRKLWLRWVAANGLGEMFGLGLTFILGAGVMMRINEQESVVAIIISFVVAVASGVVEATIVGLAQWWAMHPWFPAITRISWWVATLIGALVAYGLGYLPSTLMNLGEQAAQTQTPIVEPEQWVVLLLAAVLGVVGGAVLSFAQWLTMRRKVPRASLWIPANMLAWLVGMPLIFLGIDIAQGFNELWQVLVFMAGVLLVAGLVVGAIHGLFLVRLAQAEKSIIT